jgi:hypothetical protein
MAGDLVESPDTAHTVAHDLESFFWVLLWVVMIYVKTNWDAGKRTTFISNTMSPRVFGTSGTGSGGTGGDGKIAFLTSEVTLNGLRIEGNRPLVLLMKSWKLALAERHHKKAGTITTTTLGESGTVIMTTMMQETLDGSMSMVTMTRTGTATTDPYVMCGEPPFTDNHVCMLGQITSIHKEPDWPSDDKACPQDLSLPRGVLGVSKRSMSVAGASDFTPAPTSKRQA